MAPLTTLQVGGAARYFAELKRQDDVREAVQFARGHDLRLFVLGGGSNLVVADSGWPGLVLRIAIGGIATPNPTDLAGNAVLFSVGAGVDWDDFVAQAVAQNCAGVEARAANLLGNERRRLWPGGVRHHRIGARLRSERRSHGGLAEASVRVPLSHQHL